MLSQSSQEDMAALTSGRSTPFFSDWTLHSKTNSQSSMACHLSRIVRAVRETGICICELLGRLHSIHSLNMPACTNDHGCHQRCRKHSRIQVSSHMPSMPFCARLYHGPQDAKQHKCNRASCTASVKVLSTLQLLDSKLSERF